MSATLSAFQYPTDSVQIQDLSSVKQTKQGLYYRCIIIIAIRFSSCPSTTGKVHLERFRAFAWQIMYMINPFQRSQCRVRFSAVLNHDEHVGLSFVQADMKQSQAVSSTICTCDGPEHSLRIPTISLSPIFIITIFPCLTRISWKVVAL